MNPEETVKDCARLLSRRKLPALLVSDPVNLRYLLGTEQIEGYLLLTQDATLYCITSFLYEAQAKTLPHLKVITVGLDRSMFSAIAETLIRLKVIKAGFEAKHLPFLEYKTLSQLLAKKNIQLCPTKDLLASLRMIKSPLEIDYIKKSAQISQEAFSYTAEILSEHMTEKNLSIEIEKFLRLKGDNDIAFKPIVASGSNSVYPHYVPQDMTIGTKNLLIDLGSKYHGYCADLTRMFFCSKMPALFKKIVTTVKRAQELAIRKVKDGVCAGEVDAAARTYIHQKGFGKFFGHGTGHGLGLAVHEPPFLRPQSEEVLREGMVITLEPAIYYKNTLGVRLEDMVLVRHGKAEIISQNSSAELRLPYA